MLRSPDGTQPPSKIIRRTRSLTVVPPSCFRFCKLLKSINFGSHIAEVGLRAFNGCTALETLTLGVGVSVLSEYSFSGCKNLSVVVIPSGSKLSAIQGYTFYDTALNRFDTRNESEFVFENGALLNGAKDTLIYFISNPDVKSYIVPGNIVEIGQYAFMGSMYLREVIISDGNFKRVGYLAFSGCESLKRLVFPGSLIEIFDDAFVGCENILCGGLFLPERLKMRAKEAGMGELPLSDGCLNNFDALLRKNTCNRDNNKFIMGLIFSLLIGNGMNKS